MSTIACSSGPSHQAPGLAVREDGREGLDLLSPADGGEGGAGMEEIMTMEWVDLLSAATGEGGS